ncbi:glycine betaine ABC transporter substrate-binding protein [Rhodoligotrophos defluvii]|uniref:glycine betaine ABC transporter substrate-binding protein n=1 Tax=Rhodoligotrophos defluvii TaxID=2561934 RepID=UPI0010C9F541|nr:glycine betaine ABC transporter substrate-binding protein [Rhodoligotrophos defluvii]
MTLPRTFGIAIIGAMLSIALSAVAMAASITVGGKDFTEQFLVAEMTKQLLESKGYTVEKKDNMGTNIVRAALEGGEVDLYWEYTGTSLVTFNKVTEQLSPEQTYARVKELDGAKGLVWLAPSNANNTYALAIRKNNPKTDGMTTLSDLAKAYNDGKEVLMGTTAEFPKREDGLIGLQKAYGFKAGRANVRPMEIGLVYPALANGDIDVATVGATDGRIAAMDLVLLKDDRGFFPNYALAPVVRKETLDAHPDLKETLESLSTKLDDATMQRLNGQVDVEKKSVEEVARNYLKQAGLI